MEFWLHIGGNVHWFNTVAGLITEEIYQAVVKAGRLPPQYASVVGVGIPINLWNLIGVCLQFKAARSPSFSTILATFLRHLQEIPRSPTASPENDLIKCPGSAAMESHASILEVVHDTPKLLHRLVLEGNTNDVRNLLAMSASGKTSSSIASLLASQNADGQTALLLDCRYGSTEMVEIILEHREADIDVLDKDRDPPLVFALAAGSLECVRTLNRRNADVRSRLRDGYGPSVAHVCAYHGQLDLIACRNCYWLELIPMRLTKKVNLCCIELLPRNIQICVVVILENGTCQSMSIRNSKDMTPLHLSVTTYNILVVRHCVEVATPKDISNAIEIPSPIGIALCMDAALKKDHGIEDRELM